MTTTNAPAVLSAGQDQLVATTQSQATQIESARAVAEVQAAVTVAQAVPRDRGHIKAEIQETFGMLATAQNQFYSMPRAGGRVEGTTVHAARELARIYGNIDQGVRELRRDDDAGESEIQAFAWDQERNVRATRSFIVPHSRMAKGKRQKITDLGDINLNNNNVSARAVRECIFQVLPAWVKDLADQTGRNTLRNGEGAPLEQRTQEAVGAFQRLGVDERMLTDRIGKPRSGWTAGDISDLLILHGTLTRGETTVDDEFNPTEQAPDALTQPKKES